MEVSVAEGKNAQNATASAVFPVTATNTSRGVASAGGWFFC